MRASVTRISSTCGISCGLQHRASGPNTAPVSYTHRISNQRGIQILPLAIPEFIKKYPYVKVDLVEYGSATLERLTLEGQCDLALITTTEKPNHLHYVLIENEQLVLMAARSTDLAHRFADGEPIDITDAEKEKFVSMSEGRCV